MKLLTSLHLPQQWRHADTVTDRATVAVGTVPQHVRAVSSVNQSFTDLLWNSRWREAFVNRRCSQLWREAGGICRRSVQYESNKEWYNTEYFALR